MGNSSEIFSRNLRRIRKDMGMSQEKFAELCEVDRTYISALERMLRNPSFKAIDKLSEKLGLRPEDFFKE